jgi:hypothetical protein
MPLADLRWLDADTWPPMLALFVLGTLILAEFFADDWWTLFMCMVASGVAVLAVFGVAALIA